jgi:hypothetical protein
VELRQHENSAVISLEILSPPDEDGTGKWVARNCRSRSGLDKLAAITSGLPKRRKNDARETVLGSFGREYAGGAVSLRQFCIDRAGHVESKVEFVEESAGVYQTTTLIRPVAASGDLFF